MFRFPFAKICLLLCSFFLLVPAVLADEESVRRAPFDFDGDNKTDLTVYRPASGTWYILKSLTQTNFAANFGVETDKIVPGDFDGDGKDDLAVFRPSDQTWYIQQSLAGFRVSQWGLSGDQPFTGYFDADQKADLAVIRTEVSGALTWYVQLSNGGFLTFTFGEVGDIPVRGDFDGDGRSDIAFWRPSSGAWAYHGSSDSQDVVKYWGQGILGDMVGAGDYDGDGKTDPAVFRSSTGVWHVLKSTDGATLSTSFGGGIFGDIPVPGNYDGDTKSDYAVWRPSNNAWYILGSTAGFYAQYYGSQALGDRLAPSAFDSTGTLVGTVKDSSGAAVNGALVEARIQGILKATTTSSSTGSFYIPGLAAGRYELKVSLRTPVTSSSCSATAYEDAFLTGIELAAAGSTFTNVAIGRQLVCADDDFNDGLITPVWSNGLIGQSGNPAIGVSETNGRLEASIPIVAGANQTFNGLRTVNTYNVEDRAISMRVVSQGNEDTNLLHRVEARLEVGPSSGNYLRLGVGDNGIVLYKVVGNNTPAELLAIAFYNQSIQGYVRLRIESQVGQNVLLYVDTSPTGDDASWTNQNPDGTAFNDFALTASTVSVSGGSYGPNQSPTKTITDDFRIAKFEALAADAGEDKTIANSQSTTLAGTKICVGCTPVSGLSYKWTLAAKPSGAADPAISSSTSATTGVGPFTYPGYYTFQFSVTETYRVNNIDSTTTSYDTVRVLVIDPPVGRVSTTGTLDANGTIVIVEDEPIVFDAGLSTGSYEYRWQFGEGHEAEIARATHVYTTQGTYTVTLIVKNELGAPATPITKTVRVDAVPTGSTTASPVDHAALIIALNTAAASNGSTDIVLSAGVDYGAITLPARSSSSAGYITLRSSMLGSLPGEGVRVSAVDSTQIAKMPRISTATVDPAMDTAAAAHHYRFRGVMFRRAEGSTSRIGPLVALADPSPFTPNASTSVWQIASNQPHHLVFDRCVFSNIPDPSNGTTTTAFARRGMQLDGSDISVLNSDFRDFKDNGTDSQAIGSWSGLGRHGIINNYLEGVSENILYGGAAMRVRFATPSDITIRGNYFFKPLSWATETNGNIGCLKNLLEVKHARNMVVDGNVFRNSFTTQATCGNQLQKGYGLVITVRDDSFVNPWATIEHVQITRNQVDHTSNGLNILGVSDLENEITVNGSDFIIKNNLWTGIGDAGGDARGRWITVNRTPQKVWLIHNTAFTLDDGVPLYALNSPLANVDSGFRFDNNIFKHGINGFTGDSGISSDHGIDVLNAYFPGWVMRKNVMGWPSATQMLINRYPNMAPNENRFLVNDGPTYTMFKSEFVNYAGGNYRLTAASLGHLWATDGTDVGGNIDSIETATGGALSGHW